MSEEEIITETNIVEIRSRGGKGLEVRLDPEPYRPSGGGQPGDRGQLVGEDFEADVRDVRAEDGRIWAVLSPRRGAPAPGMKVRSELDRAWREICSRMHSGEHILSRALERAHEGLHVTKVAVDDPVTHIYLTYPGELSWEDLFSAEAAANRIVAEDRPVEAETLEPEAARELPELKANWARLPDEPIRVIRIRDYDCIACCGTHVSRTGEVGGVHVLGWRGTAPEYEIDFTVRRGEALESESRLLRRLIRTIGCRPEELEKVFSSLQEDRKGLSKALDRARDLIRLPLEEVPGAPSIRFAVVTGLPSELAVSAAKRAAEEAPEAVVLVLLPSGTDDSAAFLLCRGAEVSLDLRTFLKGHPELAVRGGGAPGWVSGRTGRPAPAAWVEALKADGGNL